MSIDSSTTEKDWASLINDIIENLTLSQAELAEMCKVSQQAVSKWTKGITKPGKFAQRQITNLVSMSSVLVRGDINTISSLEASDEFTGTANEDLTRKHYFNEFIDISSSLPLADVEDILKYARYRKFLSTTNKK